MDKQSMHEKISEFLADLAEEERTRSTVKLYKRIVKEFVETLPAGEEIRKSHVIVWKNMVIENHKPSTTKLYITVVNKFIAYCEFSDIKHRNKSQLEVKQIREQKNFSVNNVVSNAETKRLIRYANMMGYKDMALIIQTFVDTGIRVNELKEFTIENLKGKTQIKINSKGKLRQITINDSLKEKINEYIKIQNIESGYIFPSPRDSTKVISRFTIDKRLKAIAGRARISYSKAHAHSFRHLFAKNMERLGYPTETIADVLGHSSVETTRRYMRKNNEEMKEIMNDIANLRNRKKGAKHE